MRRISRWLAMIAVVFLIHGLAFADPAFTVKSTGNVDMLIDRGSPTHYGNLQYASDNTLLWAIGLRGVGPAESLFFHDENAGTSRMMIDGTSGYVGIGLDDPAAQLHVNGQLAFSQGQADMRIQEVDPGDSRWSGIISLFGIGIGSDTGANRQMVMVTDGFADDPIFTVATSLDTGENWLPRLAVTQSGNVGIGTTIAGHPLTMDSGAHVTVGGVWQDASSREYKENIANLTQAEAISALEKLNPVKFNYKAQKDEEYIGFIAEDVPELVATGDRKSLSSMDIVAVLTKVVQQQQKQLADLEARLNASPGI